MPLHLVSSRLRSTIYRLPSFGNRLRIDGNEIMHMQLCYLSNMEDDILVYSNVQNLIEAGQFAQRCLQHAELRTFDRVDRNASAQSVLVYVSHSDEDHVSSLLKELRTAVNVVVYCAHHHMALEEAARLGRLIGEVRPQHTELVFDATAAFHALQMPHHSSRMGGVENRLLGIRTRLGLTQTEMGRALGVSLRTIQNWERLRIARGRHQLRDLEELSSLLSTSIPEAQIPQWLVSENASFEGKRPKDLILDGRARDIINEFQRLQAGDAV